MVLLKTDEHSGKAALISGLLNDQDGLFNLYDTYAPSLLGLLMKWAKEKEKAEMLLHQTFIKAWHNRNLFKAEKEDLFFWLCKLARNCYTEVQ